MTYPAPIAVVGVAFRLPGGADNLDGLEDLLYSGKSGHGPVPKDRWNSEAFYSTQQNVSEAIASRHGYFLNDDISKFDARFFQIGRKEACGMDPKQRLLLQTTYEALENAGIPMEKIKGSNTSVHVSTFTYDYERMGYRDLQGLSGSHVTGTGPAILSNRLSYFFDLKGPSFTLDTGCSGGLIALHQACQSLRLGESSMAIAAGVQLLIDPDQTVNMNTLGMINPDGHCYAFDSRGNGYARGEGVATLILKPLERALAEGDHVHTVIVNSGINQDGRSSGSIMSPQGDAQRDLMRAVYAECGLDAGETPYVEAHGTGTKVGDVEEMSSIHQVFNHSQARKADVVVGSVKANVGHLEASAGLAGLLKSILVLRSRAVPPQIRFAEPKPMLELETRRIRIPRETTRLDLGPINRASVNSFGYGGTNCHVIIESLESYCHRSPRNPPAGCTGRGDVSGSSSDSGLGPDSGLPHHGTPPGSPAEPPGPKTRGPRPELFLLTANSQKSLRSSLQRLQNWISKPRAGDQICLQDLAYTLSCRRSILPWRQSIVATDIDELHRALGQPRPRKRASQSQVVFVFTGQGAQWAGMGRELIPLPTFHTSLRKSEALLRRAGCPWNLIDEITLDESSSRLGKAEVAQPATTALQIALLDLLASLNVTPSCVVGHSSGEIAAAYAAGALSHAAAIEAAWRRGMYSAQAKSRSKVPGSMLAVGLGDAEVRAHINQVRSGRLCVACINSAKSTTVSGDEPAIDELKRALDATSIFARKLKVDTAYHSHHMQEIAESYRESLKELDSRDPQSGTALFSSVTASRKVDEFGADYWVRNLVSPVKFSEAIGLASVHMKSAATTADSTTLVVEIGPAGALAGPTKETLSASALKYSYVSALNRKENARQSLLTCVGQLLESGYELDAKALSTMDHPGSPCIANSIPNLPSYPFDESSYWAESRVSAAHRFRPFPYHDLCGLLDPACSTLEPRWRHRISLQSLPWLRDHVVDGAAIFPASGYIAMVIEAMRQLRHIQNVPGMIKNFLIDEATFLNPISIPVDDDTNMGIELQLTMSPAKVGARWHAYRFVSYDADGGVWVENSTGIAAVETTGETDEICMQNMDTDESFSAIEKDSSRALEHHDLYSRLAASGNSYGPTFSLLEHARFGADLGTAELSAPDFGALLPGHYMQPHVVHPTTLDATIHVATLLSQELCLDASMVVGKIHNMSVSANFLGLDYAKLRVVSSLSPQDSRTVIASTSVFYQTENSTSTPVIQAVHTLQAFRTTGAGSTSGPFVDKPPLRITYQRDMSFSSGDRESDNAALHVGCQRSVDMMKSEVLEADITGEQTAAWSCPSTVKIIYGDVSDISKAIVAGLKQRLSGTTVSTTVIEDIDLDRSTTYVVLDHAEQAVLLQNSEKKFLGFRQLLTSDLDVIWVTLRASSAPTAVSTASMINGASRVIRREHEGSLRLHTLNVDEATTDLDLPHFCDCLAKIVSMTGSHDGESSSGLRNEYVYRGGTVVVPSLRPDDDFTEWLDRLHGSHNSLVDSYYHKKERPLQLEVGVPGLINTLRFTDDVSATEPLQPWEIQIAARAHGVNFKDVFISLGQMPASVKMVGEVAGVVTSVGKDMQQRYRPGDRVMGFFAKPFASMPRFNGDLACLIPAEMDFQTAATIPCTYATAFHCLFRVANFRRNQSILITAASGGVGQAAIQLARYAGAGDIFVTLGSLSKKNHIMKTYGIPESHIFSSRSLEFKKKICSLTNGRGVDVVINSLTGDMLSEAFECVAKLGTFCEIGKGDIYKSSHLSLKPFDRSITFAAVDLVVVADEIPEAVQEYLVAIADLFTTQSLHPVTPINVFSINEAEKAFRLIAGRKHIGKIVLDSPEPSIVRATIPKPLPLRLSQDGVYVVAGGLGGVGKPLASFLASKGAGHIVLLSRRKFDANATAQLLDELALPKSSKVHVLQCDIAKGSQVMECAKYCEENIGVVKGVIHSAMLLSDRPFSTMSFAEFSAPLGPKVYGTLNLDKAFGSPFLDFFVMLSSSATVIGNGSQTNYAAANAFQDGFAQARLSETHTNYAALNLGAVENTSAIASASRTQGNRLKSISMTMEELFLALEYALGLLPEQSRREQLVLGISRQALLDADDRFCLSDPLFSDLPRANEENEESSGKKKSDVKSDLRMAKSMQEAQTLVTNALLEKCASFLDRNVAEVPLDLPLSSIGFDSLVSIELKNWIIQKFEATVQTAQISSATGVAALAVTIASRSRLIEDGVKTDNVSLLAAAVKPAVAERQTSDLAPEFDCCAVKPPPELPLPSLDDYLRSYEESVSAFAYNAAEKTEVQESIDSYRAPGGLGHSLYQVLEERAKDPSSDVWYTNTDTPSLLTYFRHPIVPWNVFVHTHHDSERSHSQAERAALISTLSFDFLRRMNSNEVEHDWLGSRPLCSYYWLWMFGAVREPNLWCDKMQRYPASRHVAVLRKGHLFRVPLEIESRAVSFGSMQAAFQSILDIPLAEERWDGIMTTDFRDPWALNREKLLSISPENVEYFQTIEQATFVVCLDDTSPTTNYDRVWQATLDRGLNRWFDKTTQFVVSANGRSAHIAEHTIVDGTTPLRLTEYLHDAIVSHTPDIDGGKEPPAPVKALKLQTTPDIDAHLERLRLRYARLTATKGYRYFKTSTLSHSIAAQSRISPKASLDLAIQLAGRLHFGYNVATWEPVSMQHFHKGRPDIMQPLEQHVERFCDSAMDEHVPLSTKRSLMEAAARTWEVRTDQHRDGKGFLRRSEALLAILCNLKKSPDYQPILPSEEEAEGWTWVDTFRQLVPEGKELPSMYTNPSFQRMYPGEFYHVLNEGEFVDASAFVMGTRKVWISKRIRKDYVSLSISGDVDDIEVFEGCFKQAAQMIHEIMI